MSDVAIEGVLIAPLLVWMFLALMVNALVRHALAWAGVYRWVWHRALFDAALYVVLLGGVVAAGSYWTKS